MLHASNVIGALMPVEEVGKIARKKGIAFLVDVAQTAGICFIDVEAMNIDLLAFTSQKGLVGPQGVYISGNGLSRNRLSREGRGASLF